MLNNILHKKGYFLLCFINNINIKEQLV